MTERQEIEARILNLLRSPLYFAQFGHIIRPKYLGGEGQIIYKAITHLHGFSEGLELQDEDYAKGLLRCEDLALVVKQKARGRDTKLAREIIESMADYKSDFTASAVVRKLYEEYRDLITVRELITVASVQLEQGKPKIDSLREVLTEVEVATGIEARPADFGTLIPRVTAKREQRVPFGFVEIDAELQGGLEPGELAIIGGYGKSGKSALLVSIAVNEMRTCKRPVLYISLADLHTSAIEMRVACQLLDQPEREVLQNPEDMQTLAEWQAKHKNWFLPIDLCFKRIAMRELVSIISRAKLEHEGLRLVIVDRAETMAHNYGGEQHRHRLAQVFQDIRGIAESTQTAIITDSQTGVVSEWARTVTPSMAHESRVDKFAILDIWLGIGRSREDPEVRYFNLLGRRNIKRSIHRFRLVPEILKFEPELMMEED